MAGRNFSNTAVETTLSSAYGSGITSIQVASVTGFPAVPFTIVIAPGEASEEVCLVTNVAGTTLTVTRGYNGTTAMSQALGAVVKHAAVAMDFQEANDHVNNTTSAHGVTFADLLTTSNTKTVTGKTISGASNALSNIPQSAVTGLVADIAARVAASIVDAKGDLIAATAADTVARLAVGTNGHVLTADSGQATGLKWSAPPMMPVGTASPSGSSAIQINNCFTSAYRFYLVTWFITANTGAPVVNLRMRASSTDNTSSNYANTLVIDNPTAPASALSTLQDKGGFFKADADGSWGQAIIFNPAHAVPTAWLSEYVSDVTSPVWGKYAGAHNVSAAYDGLSLTPVSGTLSGEVRVYALPLV